MAWNGSTGANASRPAGDSIKKRSQRSMKLGTPLIGLLVVLIAVGAYFALSRKLDSSNDDTKTDSIVSSRIAEVNPEVATNVAPHKPITTLDRKIVEDENWDDSFLTNSEKRLKFSVLIMARTNEEGVVTERFRLPNGQTWRRVTDPPPIFNNRADQAIAMVISNAAGSPMPPVPGLEDADLDQEFAKAFAEPIRIDENDKPNVVAMKMAVMETRQEIAKMIKNGDTRSVGEILSGHIEINNRTAEMHRDALLQLEVIRRDEGDDFAREYLEKVNEKLNSYGMQEIEFDFDGVDDRPERAVQRMNK